jgi:hypothetical protein
MPIVADLPELSHGNSGHSRNELLENGEVNRIGSVGSPDNVIGSAKYSHIQFSNIIDLEASSQIARNVLGFLCVSAVCSGIIHLDHVPPVIFILPEPIAYRYDLVHSKMVPPPVTIGSMKGHSIITVCTHALDKPGEATYIIVATQHPKSLIQVKEWVGISILPKQYPLTRLMVNSGHRPFNFHHFTIAAISYYAVSFHLVKGLG